MKNIFRTSLAALLLLAPYPVFAAVTSYDLFSILGILWGLVRMATPIVVALALLAFFWGLAMYTGFPTHYTGEGDHKRKTEGRTIMLWGIITLFIVFSIGGIIAALQSTFRLQNQSISPPSAIPPSRVGP